MKNQLIPTEHDEQCNLISWTQLMVVIGKIPELKFLTAIPHGGARAWSQGKKLKAEGVKPGVPDLMWPLKTEKYSGLFIEMKRIEGGTLSVEQQEWKDWLNSQGFLSVVCKGSEEARQVILAYYRIKINNPKFLL